MAKGKTKVSRKLLSKRGNRRDSGSRETKDEGRSPRRSTRPRLTKVICDGCKKECEVPFVPSSHKPTYCNDCYKKESKSVDHSADIARIHKKLDKIMSALKIH